MKKTITLFYFLVFTNIIFSKSNSFAPPVISVSYSASLCDGVFTDIIVTSDTPNTTYTWSASTANINNFHLFGDETNLNQTVNLVNTSSSGYISIVITPFANGETGSPIIVGITVNPIPGTPIGMPTTQICSGDNANLMISTNPLITGTILDWEVIEAVNITPIYVTQGSGLANLLISEILITETNSNGFIRYRVTSRLNNCIGSSTDFTIFVSPTPQPMLIDGIIYADSNGDIVQPYLLIADGISSSDYEFKWYYNGTLIVGATENTYTATQAGTYSVIVTNIITGCSSEEVFAFVIQETLSINLFESTQINLYPNPAVENIYIETDELINEIIVFNTIGQIVLKNQPNSKAFSIDISNLQNGQYFVTLISNSITETKKFIKK
jgi:hypothetical protein